MRRKVLGQDGIFIPNAEESPRRGNGYAAKYGIGHGHAEPAELNYVLVATIF